MNSPRSRRRTQSNIVGGLIHVFAEVGAVAFMLALLTLIGWLLVTII